MKVEYFDLRGKRALVSGGASGIGASIVEHLCEQGVEVYFFDINKNEAKKTINKIKKKKFLAKQLMSKLYKTRVIKPKKGKGSFKRKKK